jgi:hypothetical protein
MFSEVSMGFFALLGVVIAFFWSLVTLRDLKDGQAEILQRLKRIEDVLQVQSHVASSSDDR